MEQPRYLTRLVQIQQLDAAERQELQPIADQFAFRSNDYYQGLIDWTDPADPIRRIIMPDREELNEWGHLDASEESSYTVIPGLEHKYPDTALLLINDICGGYCRFCFRKRLFMPGNDEVVRDVAPGLEYIRSHSEITNVLLSGGDPLILPTRKLEAVVQSLAEIEHVRLLRIGTKMLAFNPHRILDDPSLPQMIERLNGKRPTIFLILHFNHPRELTDLAREAIRLLQRAGAVTVNQTPLIRGVNSDPETLALLWNELSYVGVHPYYIFQCRPTLGNQGYAVPLETSYEIITEAQSQCSGLAGQARFVMSHATGKLEITGLTEKHVRMRYRRAARPENRGRELCFARNPDAFWLDDYSEATDLLPESAASPASD